ncbi:MAG: hypothetical protein AVO38_14000 [delta proteobacterium ML8_D]|jgi:calcineurin-like phosphoesterase family protein|nr:MAG: hypothetical protein AVO38_14000 [delta proteobacterium ML8_D]
MDINVYVQTHSHVHPLADNAMAETGFDISGDISDYLPLSRTSISQHMEELSDPCLIQGAVYG